jgi:HlyD family secretion protein
MTTLTAFLSGKPKRLKLRLPRPAVLAGGAAVLLAVLFGARALMPHKAAEPYRTQAVERGDLTRSVSASGSLQALVTVQVGSQVSGQIKQVLVDFNSPVKKGELLATIDPETYETQVNQAKADVGTQNATLAQQQANLQQAEAQLRLDQINEQRARTLTEKGVYSASSLDTAEAAYQRSAAAVAQARAQIGAQRARMAQSAASLKTVEVNLGRTRIFSPIDGVVVNRAIDPGQTVQASFQAPTLFQIAQDLSKLQVKIMVDEADIGQVQEGQAVRFTVDAFPDQTFTGVVTQVRKQPETQANVVAYSVIAEADNPGGRLLPGMTANADIVIQQLNDVLKVPAAALRFTPADRQPPQPARGGPGFGGPVFIGGGPPGGFRGGPPQGARAGGFAGPTRMLDQLDLSADQKAKADAIFADMRTQMQSAGQDREARRKLLQDSFGKLDAILNPAQKQKLAVLRAQSGAGGARGPNAVVWILRNNKPVAVAVRTGATDGSFTEISGPLKPGDQVIVGGGPRPKLQARGGILGPQQRRG